MEGLELAAGWVPGHVPLDQIPWPDDGALSVRRALARVLRRHLSAPPCVVSFSGGRDSSVVLAVASDVARREGLPLPVPATRHHPGVPELDEERWQRRVLDHLALRSWIRLPFTDELDVVGPVAQRVLRRYGVVWPAAAHTWIPLFGVAGGGTVLTGEGGDELFDPHRLSIVRQLAMGPPSRRRTRAVARTLAPPAVRRRQAYRTHQAQVSPWLTRTARNEVARLLADDDATAPMTMRPTLQRLLARRAWRTGARTFDRLAGDAGVRIAHPMLDPEVLVALHRSSGPWGYASRTRALQALFSDLLPADVLTRQGKVVFNRALFHRHSRELAASWAGDGLDAALIEKETLRDEWRREVPSFLSAPLLQEVWRLARG